MWLITLLPFSTILFLSICLAYEDKTYSNMHTLEMLIHNFTSICTSCFFTVSNSMATYFHRKDFMTFVQQFKQLPASTITSSMQRSTPLQTIINIFRCYVERNETSEKKHPHSGYQTKFRILIRKWSQFCFPPLKLVRFSRKPCSMLVIWINQRLHSSLVQNYHYESEKNTNISNAHIEYMQLNKNNIYDLWAFWPISIISSFIS